MNSEDAYTRVKSRFRQARVDCRRKMLSLGDAHLITLTESEYIALRTHAADGQILPLSGKLWDIPYVVDLTESVGQTPNESV
jgi:hypothetical protein